MKKLIQKHTWLVAILVMAVALFMIGWAVLIIFAFAPSDDDPAANTGEIDRRTVQVSWAEGFPTLSDMTQAADLVVQGTVSKSLGVRHPGTGIVVTRFALDTTQAPINHVSEQALNQIIVHQTGGIQDGTLVEVADYPLLNVGEEVILFLKQIEEGEYQGEYRILAGPQGMFTLDQGMVKARSESHVASFAGPVPVDEFLQNLEQ